MTSPVTNLNVSELHPVAPSQTLSESVADSLKGYFSKLDGHAPDDLYRLVLEEVEKPLLESVMNYCGGNQTKAAKCLGLNRGTLRKKLKHYDIR
ncbi:MAG: DNA-binding transcriptional regulator Fis [Pseudomonadota bacterium]|jgi:Fis family transcriptional regulator